jgi:hypothetical protein
LIHKIKAENPQIINENLIFPGQNLNVTPIIDLLDLKEILSQSHLVATQTLNVDGRNIKVYFVEPRDTIPIDKFDTSPGMYFGEAIVMNLKNLKKHAEILRGEMENPNENFPGRENF